LRHRCFDEANIATVSNMDGMRWTFDEVKNRYARTAVPIVDPDS
jgi:hypothetical protein